MSTPVILYIIFVILPTCFGVDLTYYVEEGKNPGTYLGDIAADTHLMDSVIPEEQQLVTFSQLHKGAPGNSQLFRVSKETGKFYMAQMLDAETLCKHNTECFEIVKVAIRRAETFMKIVKVKVMVKDVNDHQPEFPKQQVDIEFSEGDIMGTKISIPNAIDRDVGVLNSQITYQLKKDMYEPFTLSVSKSVDGTSDLSIILEERLDREVKDSYVIQVIARDGGSPPKQSVLDVHISVTDVNDNPPVFSRNVYNVSIKYEHEEAIPVTILSARDSDTDKNSRISYHFSPKTSELSKSHFKVNEVTGEIFLQKKFTSKQKLSYKLYVRATDGGNPPLSSIAMVIVNVVNQQNNAPTIDVNFVSGSTDNTASISEDIKVGSFIAYVMVTDYDSGKNGEVSCNLQHNKFQLLSLGRTEWKVTVKSPLDRETQDHHDITINCQDKGSPPLHTESKFAIEVIDVNDVRPRFTKETLKFWIYENQKSNFPVGAVNASDPDLGPGGKLSYSLLTDKKNFLPFQITDRGLISTVMSLDYEFQHSYKFQVFVKDNGVPSLNNTVNVSVEIRDENDNAPYFTFPSVNPFTLDVLYYPRHSNNITVLKASDSDSRENAFLRYDITSGNDKQLFAVNPYTGLLSFTRVVTQYDTGSYDLQFVVKDSGTPVLSATTTLLMMLTVTNRSSEMLDVVISQSEERIHLHLLIVIVVVSVILSVPITAAMSICIVRCKDQGNSPRRTEGGASIKSINEQGHYMCPSHNATYWTSGNVDLTPERSASCNTFPSTSKRGLYPVDELSHGRKGTKFQGTSDSVYQIHLLPSAINPIHQ